MRLASKKVTILPSQKIDHLFELAIIKLPNVIDIMQDIRYNVMDTWIQNTDIQSVMKFIMNKVDDAQRDLVSCTQQIDKEILSNKWFGDFLEDHITLHDYIVQCEKPNKSIRPMYENILHQKLTV